MVIVTGATGHIGNVLVRELTAKGITVRALVLPNERPVSISQLPIEMVRGDVTDYASLQKAFDGVTCVYHLAGIVTIGSGKRKILQKVNVEGTGNVIRACFEKGVKRLVYTSSIHAFPELPHGQILVETKDFDERKVRGDYAKSKALATKMVLDAAQNGLDTVILHPTGVIGPYEYQLSNMGQLMVDFMKRRLFAYIDGTYDFVDVRDVVQGIISASEKGRPGENYILSGEQITVKRLLEHLENATGLKAPRIKIPIWFAKATAPLSELYYMVLQQQPLYTSYSIETLYSNSLASHNKAENELGYKTRPIQEAIFDTVSWLKDHMNTMEDIKS
jgi:dihydroflavonol-4-reductase